MKIVYIDLTEEEIRADAIRRRADRDMRLQRLFVLQRAQERKKRKTKKGIRE